MSVRKLLLVSNSPRVHRYFGRLRENVQGPEIVVRGRGVELRGPFPGRDCVDSIIEYGMRRKRARPWNGPLQLEAFRRVYSEAAKAHYANAIRTIEKTGSNAVGVWGGQAVDVRSVREAARTLGIPCLHFENGFLPDTTQMDWRGVNVGSSLPRDPRFYEGLGIRTFEGLPERLVPRAPRRSKRKVAPIPLPERFVFVPFQVRLDSQVLLFSPWISGMRELFGTLVRALYMADVGSLALVFKEHPSCPERYPDLHQRARDLSNVHFANGNPTEELIRRSLGVVTLNSSVGCEALLLDRAVLALADAVYEVPGVAESSRSVEGIVEFLRRVALQGPPPAPLRLPFLHFLSESFLIPDRHQAPGPRHFARAGERFSSSNVVYPPPSEPSLPFPGVFSGHPGPTYADA